jgi:alkanesulfonate monooxygenase SsuD/methylene tetrahydromethanopterin reductase-like flavin-dependent oxidoreductase (luciferase family)
VKKVFEEVKFGYQLPPHTPNLIFDIALYLEEKGFDSVFMADHLVGIAVRRFDFLDAWNILSALAVKTKCLKLGSCVTDPHRKHPAVLAQTVMTLDHLSNGRAILGIGAGEAMNLDPYGIKWDRPVSKMYEAVKAVKECWTQPVVNFEGEIFHIKNALVDPKPIQKPHPPIWIAGNSPRTMKMTAEIADGWIPMAPPLTPEMHKKNFGKIVEWAKEYGREPESIEPALFTYVVVAKDHDTAREIIELPARMTIATLSKFTKHLKLRGSIPEEFQLHRFISNQENVAQLLGYTMDVVPPEAIDDFFVYGSPDDCIAGIERYLKAGVKHFIVAMFVRLKMMKETLQLYAEKVVPYFKEEK